MTAADFFRLFRHTLESGPERNEKPYREACMFDQKCVRRAVHLSLLVMAILALQWPQAKLWAQVDRGTITGTVVDSSGAALAGVQVSAKETSTNTQYMAVSNDHGEYSVLNLPIGNYIASFTKAGFRTLDQKGIVILANHTARVDAALNVGSVVESVEVSATPILEVQPEVGTNMTEDEVNELPLSIAGGGRDQLSFAISVTPNVSGDTWNTQVNGSQQYSKNVLIDGTSIDAGVMGDLTETGPSMDAIQQTQIDTSGIRAEEAHTGGGVFMVELKSGSNKWHGSAFGFVTNEDFDANTWDNNWYLSQCNGQNCYNGNPRSSYGRARNRYFDYGASGGGPIWKNHTFFYAAYEKYSQNDWRVNPTGATVPTVKMLGGDFSELLGANGGGSNCGQPPCPIFTKNAAGSLTNIPYTDPAGNPIYYGSIFNPDGTVVPGNVFSTGQWPSSSVAQQVVGLYKKYYQPTTPNLTGNFPAIISNDPRFEQTQFSIKFDHNISTNDHFASSYIYNHRPKTEVQSAGSPWIANTTNGGPLTPNSAQELHTNAYRFSETHTFNTRMLNVLSYTFNQFQNIQASVAQNSPSAKTLGLSSSYPDKATAFPQITFNGSPNGVGLKQIGSTWPTGDVVYHGIVNEAFSWSKGRHNLKFGSEVRALGYNQATTPAGAYSFGFSNNTFAPDATDVQPNVGSAFANMGLGQVQYASQTVAFNQYSRRKELAFFAQDDYKVSGKLTLNLDLRWDITNPLHELHGHWTNFDLTAHDLNFGNYNGAFTWLAHPNDSFETKSDYHQFGPHIGGSYQTTTKSVARASYGIMYSPLSNTLSNAVPFGSAVGYQGSSNVSTVPDVNGRGVAAFQWDTGYPGKVIGGTGPIPNQGYMQGSVANIDPHSRQLGIIQNLFVGYQYQLTSDLKVDVNYVGTFGSNLHDPNGSQANIIPFTTYRTLLMSGHVNDNVTDPTSAQAAGVPYPYAGWAHAAVDALRPYPQTTVDGGYIQVANAPVGRSGYNGFNVEVTKREKNGMALDMSYSTNRTTGNVTNTMVDWGGWGGGSNLQDPGLYNDKKNWGTPLTTQGVKGYVTYQLPLGRGKRFLGGANRLVDETVGGWGIGAIVSYGNGGNVWAFDSSEWYSGWNYQGGKVWPNVRQGANFKNTFKKWNPTWQPSQGQDPDSLQFDPTIFSNPEMGQLGNSPKYFSHWRGWASPSENASVTKKFRVSPNDRFSASIRADFFNVFNRHYWDFASLSMWNPQTFGHVQGVTGNRTGQISARFQF